MQRVASYLLALGLLMQSQLVLAQAKEFRSVGATAVLLDGPAATARKKFIAPKGMPLQIISSVDPYYKVRDADGFEGFIEKKLTVKQRTVLATTLVGLRPAANEGGALLLQAERGVLFELLEPAANGWVKVKHADGAQGYVRASEVWGL